MSKANRRVAESKIYHFDLACDRKRFFKTEAEALEAADFGMLENMRVSLGVYHCPTCFQWHLTSLQEYPL